MKKPQRGVDGDPCPKKQRSEEGNNFLIEKDKVFKGKFAPPSEKLKIPGIRRGGALGSRAIRNFYDLSETPKITPIQKDQLFSLTQLAMWTYNFKEDTKFDNVNDRDYRKRLYQLIENDPQFKLPIYLSQFALINYSNIDLHLKAARHDISSLTIVKPMEHVSKQTTYLITFEAALCDDSKKVETFETEIYIPTLIPTTIIEFWDFEIKTN
ncbi:hypothetical protein POM88_013993 [Heracleum sosnowskyi]|uniref:Uncharacterized protein n=1 Tax=Heracleum sosnowskyi TaxID=360622 RepID=A0AAD8N3T5_9APIA|nr:hypothetical protein POM88_013993 [Heracleum sosnowskyi]